MYVHLQGAWRETRQSLQPEVPRVFELIDIIAAVICMSEYRVTTVTKFVETLLKATLKLMYVIKENEQERNL